MTYDERTNLIGSLLRDVILPRYKRPDHLDDATARAEIMDMVEDLNSAWPLMHPESFPRVGLALARNIRRSYSGRSWPPIAVMLKALKSAVSPEPVDGKLRGIQQIDLADIRGRQLLAWCRGEAPCGEGLITADNLRVLADAGHIRHDAIPSMILFAERNQGVHREEPRQQSAPGGGFARIKAPSPEGVA
jgi:hypothetical protein